MPDTPAEPTSTAQTTAQSTASGALLHAGAWTSFPEREVLPVNFRRAVAGREMGLNHIRWVHPTELPEHTHPDAEQAIFRKVGLHPGAPEFLVLAARKAFRLALHPDRHPEHRQEAHNRFIKAEAAFDKIARLRA